MKRPYLVVVSISGGLWNYIWVESEDQIRERLSRLPDGSDVEIVSDPPSWIFGTERGPSTFAIDQLPDWLLG
jgi:hypothetical protein